MKIYVTRKLADDLLQILKEKFEVEINVRDEAPSKEEIIEKVRDKDGIICLLTDKIDKDVIDAGKNLKVISNCAAGYDNVDVEYATKKKIMVTNTPGVLTEAVAELTIGMIIAIARRFIEADKLSREGRFKGWDLYFMLGTELNGKTLGIIGAGKIGSSVAKKAKCLGMNVIYYSRNKKEELEKIGIHFKPLDELLRISDFVSIHTPLTKETYHLIGERELNLMKKEAFLINTARGAVIDEKALIKALKEKRIKGAALDVYEKEPYIPEELRKLENVLLLPHIGSATWLTRYKMMKLAVENLIDALSGKIPRFLVNKEVLK